MSVVVKILNAADGVELYCDHYGNPENPPVVLSHGGGQTRHSWGETAKTLADNGWYAISYDHRGHGDSGWSKDKIYSFGQFAQDMQVVAESCHRPPAVIGASLGGLSAMLCAGELNRQLFSSITLVDVTPSLNQQGVNHIFEFMSSKMAEGFTDLNEAADVIAKFTGRSRKKDVSGLSKNLRLRDGRYYWHWDPNFFSMGSDRPTDPQRVVVAAKKIAVPTLLIRGRLSDVVTQPQVDEFFQLVPHAEYIDVEHARHMVVGDRNDIFTEAMLDFLSRQRDKLITV